MSMSQIASPTAFGRAEIARILGIDYAVVKNWSSGKPLRIAPSIRAPGRRGKENLYSLSDLYRMGAAAALLAGGLKIETVVRVMQRVEDEWFARDKRGTVLISALSTSQPKVRHLPGLITLRELVRAMLSDIGVRSGCHVLPLREVLDFVDSSIRRPRKGESMKQGHRKGDLK